MPRSVRRSLHGCVVLLLLFIALAGGPRTEAQGPLVPPPGAPSAVMRTLEQVEPRIPISSAPYIITNSGAYYLTTNLTVGGGLDGITISAGNVDLDLNGFSMTGAGGGGTAINGGGSNLVVRNGTINGWSFGIGSFGAANGSYKNLRLSGQVQYGLYCGPNSLVESCSASDNGSDGFVIGLNSVVRGCASDRNLGFGITAFAGCTVIDSTANLNTNGGFNTTAAGCTFSRCTARQNGGTGIQGVGATISECTASTNGFDGINNIPGGTVRGCTAQSNAGNGITLGDGGSALDCTAAGNAGAGIFGSLGCTIASSVARRNVGTGLIAGNGGLVRDSLSQTNGGAGISTGTGSAVLLCTAGQNNNEGISVGNGSSAEGNTSRDNKGAGIIAAGMSKIVNNACTGNGIGTNVAAGIFVTGSDNRIEDNHVSGNDTGLQVNGSRNHIAGNVVVNNADNYSFTAGNNLELLLGQIPESIDWPAAVTLAGTLTATGSVDGVTINADDVTLDLNGHTLKGTASTRYGVYVPSGRRNMILRNGTIQGWGNAGVFTTGATYSVMANVSSVSNVFNGFSVGNFTKVTQCVAAENGGTGFYARNSFGSHTIVFSGCESRNNATGYNMEGGCVVEQCTATGNSGDGFYLESWNKVVNCDSWGNGSRGLRCNYGNSVTGSRFMDNTTDGISVEGPRNVIADNRIMDNNAGAGTGDGIELTAGSNRIDGNDIVGGRYAIYVASGTSNLITRNTSTLPTSGTGYSIGAAGNSFGVAIVGGPFTNTNPWVNFSY